jgi:hypothetical protein
MTVKVTKPAINLREKLSELESNNKDKARIGALTSDSIDAAITAPKVTITDEIVLRGADAYDALFQKNASAGRNEVQLYSNRDANGTGSLGSGMHLYGNYDNEHAGNIALITGQNDAGDARLIVSGGSANASNPAHRTNTDTRVTIGNDIWDFVDNQQDTGLLNLKNPQGRPAIYISECNSATEGEIATSTGDAISFGHWDGSTYTRRVNIDSAGRVTMPYQPVFSARRNSTVNWGNYNVTYANIHTNVGNHFNGTDFTAPVAGSYFFSATMCVAGGTTGQDDTMFWGFQKNGVGYQHINDNWSYRMGSAGNGVDLVVTQSAVIYLSAGDTVRVNVAGISHTGGLIRDSSTLHGYLIG